MPTTNTELEAAVLSQAFRQDSEATKSANDVSLHSVLAIWARRKWLILRVTLLAAFLACGAVFLIPVEFTAESVILPPQQAQSAASMLMGQMTGLSALGALSGLSFRATTDLYLYIGILKDRTIADALVQKFDLRRVYGLKTTTEARKRLSRHTSIATNKDPLIHIKVQEHDPQLAADLANAYVDELFQQNSRLALTEAAQRRLFFEQQYAKEKEALATAELGLRNTEQATKLVAPGGQAEAMIRASAQLREAILERQAQFEAIKTFAAESNPAYRRLQEELSTLQAQLHRLESDGRGSSAMDLSVSDLPQASLEYLRRLRDVKYHEALFEALAKGYEAARLDEAKSAPIVQVVDRAIKPERKSWPPRTLLVLGVAMVAAILTALFVVLPAGSKAGTPKGVSTLPMGVQHG